MLTEGGSGARVRQVNEQVPLGATAAVWLGFLILLVIFRTPWPAAPAAQPQYSVATIGNAFLTDYVLIFEGTSLVLLVSLVGAIIIARRES
ncbi:MAG: NADH-quinone oxidoreductase subunit J family protein, partial [bacterium]